MPRAVAPYVSRAAADTVLHGVVHEHLEGFLAAAAARARQLIESAGQKVEYRSFPQMGHAMHQQDPKLFAATVIEWADSLLAQRAV